MSEELLSVVIPIHNVERYLDRSIQSILNQTYQNLELILVNDGSTDGSGEICEKYAEQDSRIKLLTQENQGAAAARRNGIQCASGEYITFVDADDYIDPDLYQRLMEQGNGFDVVIAQWWRESKNQIRRAGDTIAPGAYKAPEELAFLLRHLINVSTAGGAEHLNPGIAAYLWNKIIRTELVQRVCREISTDLRIFTDRPIIYNVIMQSRSVLITEICGYHYGVRENSIAHSTDTECKFLKSLCEFYGLIEPMLAKDPRAGILLPQLHLKMSEQLTRAPEKMGFEKEARLQLKAPVFPFINLLDGKRVVLYGAGPVGQSYRRQIQKWDACQVVLWADSAWEEYSRVGWPVCPVGRLREEDYDCVILALPDQVSADSARRELSGLGIEEDRILWREPLEL